MACARAVRHAGLAVAIALLPALAQAQSAGMGQLLRPKPPGQASGAPTPAMPGQPGSERTDQREARSRAEKYRTERDMADRAGRQGPPPGTHPKLSPDERKTLRKNLYDLGREMYDGS